MHAQHQQHLGLARARGDWHADAHGPLLVSDPLKARYLLGLDRVPPAAHAARHHEKGLLPYGVFMRAIPRLDFARRAELERLCSDPRLLWQDSWKNIVVNQGLNDLLNVTLGGDAQDTTWFVGLTASSPTVAAGDTLASKAWTERTEYSQATRPAWVDAGTTTTQSLANPAGAVFDIITATNTFGGAFLAGDNTKGGTTGRLYAVGAFTAGNKILDPGDTLTVTVTATTAAV